MVPKVSPEAWATWRLWQQLEGTDHLPEGGGWLDQDYWLMRKLGFISERIREHEDAKERVRQGERNRGHPGTAVARR